MNVDKIALVGLGKLGLPLLCTFAKNGQNIVGFDCDSNKIESLLKKEIPFYEPNLEEYFHSSLDRMEFSQEISKIPDLFDVVIILVNTPSNENGEFSNKYVLDVVEKISVGLRNSDKKDFLFIVSSTVMPTTYVDIVKIIEEKSGRIYNENFGLLYVPDLVAIGSIIYDFENPDLIILGESDKRYGEIGKYLYGKIVKNNPQFIEMSLIEGEITKVSLNAYITMKISFANFLGNVCDKLNCDSGNITKALGFDKRISPFYIKSGLAFGGTCFPRDTWAFIKMAENLGLDALHIKATQKINENQNTHLFNKVSSYTNKKIGVAGLSFKQNTYVTEQSPGLILYNRLKEKKYDVIGFDKMVPTDYTDNLEDFISESDVIVLCHNDKYYEQIINFDLNNKIIINPWNLKLQ